MKNEQRDLSDLFGICPYVTTQKILSGKWKLIILYLLSANTLRFNELGKRMPGVTQSTLTMHLRELEKDGLIERRVYPQIPPKVEYLMTDLGKEFSVILDAVNSFGTEYINRLGYIAK
ncbi:MAG: helix-turn-helix transcriptional regulator [Clostridiales bacterium]|jgi:DNA-binding HxlR family transcriptional regulator|nr:helix-turn-helix transcriptional regulator [Clostridiales bacterium]